MGYGAPLAAAANGRRRGPMTPERWGEIKAVLAGVMDTNHDERTATLDRLCHEDPDLRREVVALLAYEDKADSLLHTAVAPGASLRSDAAPPTTIGQYRILRELGRGG